MAQLNCLIPVHNAAGYLEESLESVRAQTFKDFEIFAFDDGSDDDSLAILKKIKKKEKRLHILGEETSYGIPYALNQLMKISKSPFFAFHGDHDLSHPERFEKQMDRMKNSSLVAIGSSIIIDGTAVDKKSVEDIAPCHPKEVLTSQSLTRQRRGIWYESAMYSKKILSNSIEFEETMPALYDILFNARVQNTYPLRISNLKEVHYTMRLHPQSVYERLLRGRIRIENEQIENFFLLMIAPIHQRYIHDVQICPTIRVY